MYCMCIIFLSCAQWQFLSRDEGEVDTQHDPSWIEDEGTASLIQRHTCT